MAYDLGGFSISQSTSRIMLAIFVVYSIIVVGIGFFIQYQSKKEGSSRLTDFFTGGGNLGAIAIAMVTATNAMAGGTMVATPGLGYSIGFIIPLLYMAGFLTAAYGLGSVGRKAAIMKNRIGAVTFQQIIGYRFQSRKIMTILSISGIFGLIFFITGQITSGAKVFAAVTGTNAYYLGMFLVLLVTVIYTLSGGMKSMARVASFQGAIMLVTTFAIFAIVIATNIDKYGSYKGVFEYLAVEMPTFLQAHSKMPFWNTLGTAIFVGIGLGALPHTLTVTMTYDNHKKLKQGIIISCLIFVIIQGLMCFVGPLIFHINPNIVEADYATMFVATNLLPAWMAGMILCGIFAAIQSSIAGMCMAGASLFAQDVFATSIKPEASDKEISRVTNLSVLAITLIAVLVAINPSNLTQYVINFALGALCASWYFPVFGGMYWKKATEKGAIASGLVGFISYVIFYLLSSVHPVTKVWWAENLGGVHAFVPAWIFSALALIIVSYLTKDDKVKLGVYQVFFCQDYNESYANLDF